MLYFFAVCLIFFSMKSFGSDEEQLRLTTIYHSLDPTSLSELFAFHELYPETVEGKAALKKVWELIHRHKEGSFRFVDQLLLPAVDVQSLISIVNKQPYEAASPLTDEQLFVLESLSSHLHHRKLKGHDVKSAQEVLRIPTEEIDLARSLLLYQYQESAEALLEVRRYEASLDLMALQILAKLPKKATHLEKIHAINDFIFHQMQFRFPAHSLMAKDIDVYTFLPSVIDQRKGVCLGVSILILSLAQRLDLPLEIVTPPGHIYVRYKDKERLINIETTARGIHMPTEQYLGINTHTLTTRTIKEVVGMAFFNQASVFWGQKKYEKAAEAYEKAILFMPEDPLVKMFLGIQYLMLGKTLEGKQLLKEIEGMTFPDCVYPEVLPEDILRYNIDKEALEVVFKRVDETRESVLIKQKQVQDVLKKYPKFRGALMQLATSYLQLGQNKKALEVLKRYHELDPCDPTINYYLSILAYQRFHYKEGWDFFYKTRKELSKKNHYPKTLHGLELELRQVEPEPMHSS